MLLGLELLQTNDVWRSLGEPSRKILEAFIDVVDVESGDFHVECCGRSHGWNDQGSIHSPRELAAKLLSSQASELNTGAWEIGLPPTSSTARALQSTARKHTQISSRSFALSRASGPLIPSRLSGCDQLWNAREALVLFIRQLQRGSRDVLLEMFN